jgi:hypothetical protein
VTNTFKAEDFNGTTPTPDVGAGFAGKTNPHNLTQSSGTSEGSAVKISSGTVSDVASNPATAIDSAAFKIDLSNPYNVQFTGGPAAGSSYDFGDTPAAPTCSAEDTVSGMPANGGCVVTGYSSAKGTHTLTATATDNAGRTATATRSYTVKPYTLNGFFSPVDMDSGTTIALNTVKGGSTVPLKFEVFKGTTELTNTSAIKIFTTKAVTCPGAEAAADEIEFLTTGSTSLRYDTTAGQFIQNWQTPKKVGCFDVTMETVDGSKITAHFKLR